MLMSFFSSRGWESWDLEHRPLIPERMPVLIDDDLLFEDGPGARRPIVAVNRWLRELPVSGAPAPSTWETYARIVKEWMEFLADRGVGVFASRERLRVTLSGYAEHRATGPVGRRFAASTWNQHVSVLASFYRWAMAEGHAPAEPFSYRTAQTVFAGIARTVRVNQASRRRPKPHVTVRYLEPDFTAMFLNGLAGLGPDGAVDRLFHGRELARNACVGGLAVATGLRLQEFTCLLAYEVPGLPRRRTEVPIAFPVPAGVTKGRKFRTTWISYDALAAVLLAAALFAHDLAAFRVHAAAGLGGDGWPFALLQQRGVLPVMLMGPGLAGGSARGVHFGAGRSGLWLLACCGGPGAGDPRGDGQRRAGVPSGEPVQDAPVPGAEFEAGQRCGQDLGPPGGGQVASGCGLDGLARHWQRLGCRWLL